MAAALNFVHCFGAALLVKSFWVGRDEGSSEHVNL